MEEDDTELSVEDDQYWKEDDTELSSVEDAQHWNEDGDGEW